ncbi:putative receptor-like serine/threonine-protein kinase [Platanthera zijinensis]|uniref:Receptor-like serine/threonine-protein kinase n=1 Tax=Platanthera zijinensis TaxID=2320716 RepID=A0AAP0B0R2_9ASPA
MWGKVFEGCGVDNFDILLLEIVTGRKPIERLPGGIKGTITEWADPFIIADQLPNLVDPRLRDDFDKRELRHMTHIIHVAAHCVQSEPDRRATMRKVLSILQGMPPPMPSRTNSSQMPMPITKSRMQGIMLAPTSSKSRA